MPTTILLPRTVNHPPLCVCLLSALRVRRADDMGWYDSQPHNPTSPTPTLGQWAKEGILLERHYVCESAPGSR